MKINADGLALVERALRRYKELCQHNEILCRGKGTIAEKFWLEEMERATVILQQIKLESEGKK